MNNVIELRCGQRREVVQVPRPQIIERGDQVCVVASDQIGYVTDRYIAGGPIGYLYFVAVAGGGPARWFQRGEIVPVIEVER